LALAAMLFPLDVAVRRLMWGETEIQSLRNRLRRPKMPRGEGRKAKTPERDESMGALLKAKQRARQEVRQEAGDRQQEAGPPTSQIPAAPPPGDVPVQPPIQSAPPPVSSAPQPQDAPPVEDEDDPMERLRRAKRRARGEE
jgi:hypothetical protein